MLESSGLESDLRVGNALVHMYAKCGSVDDAGKVNARMEERDVITWNVMSGELAQHGCEREAYELFLQMQRDGFKPNAISYVSILNASASAGVLEWVKEVHSCVLESLVDSDLRIGTVLIHAYAKCGNIDDARQHFDRMEDSRDVVTWNCMIGGLAAQHGCEREAYELFLRMRGLASIKPNATTFVSILNACANVGALRWVREIHSHVLESSSSSGERLESDLRVGNALVHMYGKSGSIDDARNLCERMENRDVITWNTMIHSLAQQGCGSESLEIFRKMSREGMVKPDEYTFVAVLSACSHAGLLDEGRRIFLAMSRDYGIEPTLVHCNCMVDLLGRAGELEEAKMFVDNMPLESNEVTWGALLAACRTHKNVKLAEFAARERVKLDPKNAATYVLVSKTYTAAGMCEEMTSVHALMHERYTAHGAST